MITFSAFIFKPAVYTGILTLISGILVGIACNFFADDKLISSISLIISGCMLYSINIIYLAAIHDVERKITPNNPSLKEFKEDFQIYFETKWFSDKYFWGFSRNLISIVLFIISCVISICVISDLYTKIISTIMVYISRGLSI